MERNTGKLLWRTKIAGFGGSAVYCVGGKLFAKSSANTLYALDPESGIILWTFSPSGHSGETMYSSPTAHRQDIFIGDRRGILYCLDVNTGTTKWKRRTNRAKNDDVNSTPLIRSGLVIVGTNANRAVSRIVKQLKRRWLGFATSTVHPHLGHYRFKSWRPSLRTRSTCWKSKPVK